MDPTHQLLTTSQLQCALMVGIAEQQAEQHADIERRTAEAQRLRQLANERSAWQQHTEAQQAMQEAGGHMAAIEAAKLAIRRLDEEREGIVRGTDPRMATARQNGTTEVLTRQQNEYREAQAAFQEMCTPVLIAAAPVPIEPPFPNGGVGTMYGSAELPSRSWLTTDPAKLTFGAGDPLRTPPALGDHKQTTRGWTPPADSRPYAVVNLPDGTTMQAFNPGTNIIEIPEKHIAYFKGQGWTLLSENM